MNQTKTNIYRKLTLFLIVLTLFASITYAYRNACLSYGETLAGGWECQHDCCRLCVTEGNNGAAPYKCNGLPPCTCGGGNFSDLQAPNITINSPVEGEAYLSRSVWVDVDISETAYLHFMEKGRERYGWQRLCSGKCTGYSRGKTYTDGEHTVTIKATDLRGNEKKKNITFYVDSIDPRIKKTYPQDGEYGNGEFTVEYTELNVVNITLFYKESGSAVFEQKSRYDCPSDARGSCTITVTGLAQGPLTYYFSLEDKAQTVYSDPVDILIDTIQPDLVVSSPHNPVLIYSDKKMLMNMTVTEPSTIEYMDYEDRSPKFKRLCTNCMGYDNVKSFNDGYHNITIRATDKAGNKDSYDAEFTIDTKKPRIKRTTPRNRGYGDGTFTVTYDEDTPKEVIVFYKQDERDPYQFKKNLDCPSGKNVECNVTVDTLEQGELYYYFSIIDEAGFNETQRRESEITIDTVDPFFLEISSPENITYYERKVYFTMNISEDVTLEYINHFSSNPTWKRLCSRCDQYDRYKAFSFDDYYLTVRATDNAGNTDHRDFLFSVVKP